MMQPMEVHQGQMLPSQQSNGASIIVTSNGEIATGDSANVSGERIVLHPNQRLIIVDPVTGQQKQIQLVQMQPTSGQQAQHHILITTQPLNSVPQAEQEDSRRMNSFEDYFMEPQSSGMQQNHHVVHQPVYQSNQAQMIAETGYQHELEVARKAKLAEMARLRYHRLSDEAKKALNKKRTIAQKRKRQRAKEMAELDEILRKSGDIVDDPEVLEQLREKRIRARWAEAARARYARMTEEQRREHNNKRRMRQMMVKNEKGEVICDADAVQSKIKEKNARKAEQARLRYHKMSAEEKKSYNKRRTEAFRRRRMEEETLLSMPVGEINDEALDRAQRVVIRNAKRAEQARLRYYKLTPEERKVYNKRRYTPKNKRVGTQSPTISEQSGPSIIVKQEGSNEMLGIDGNGNMSEHQELLELRPESAESFTEEGLDALSSIEQEINRQTRQAQEALKTQRSHHWRSSQPGQIVFQQAVQNVVHDPKTYETVFLGLSMWIVGTGSLRGSLDLIVLICEVGFGSIFFGYSSWFVFQVYEERGLFLRSQLSDD
ncbi:hypothetical protein M3Y98_00662100 [Aphelenchoides besseyi]|nr:hypothetical protein M3Y98_00662100 [Aphelenchoides besseyi]